MARSEDYNDYLATTIRKTSVVTRYFRQLQMVNFYNTTGQMYVSLGKTTPWSDPENPDISDTYPPIPDETMTAPQELQGMQRITWKKFALPYVSPTTAQKNANDTIYYKGLYYRTFSDAEEAIEAGCTAVLVLMTADRNEYFPVDISVRQACLIAGCNSTDIYLTDEQWNNLSEEDKGHIIAINNYEPLSRNATQLEKYYFLISF